MPATWRRCVPVSRVRRSCSARPRRRWRRWTRSAAAAQIVRLPDRIDARPMPPVRLVDLRHAPTVRGVAGPPWSEELDVAVTATLARREQVLLLLNRRGWAAFLQCRDCGDVLQCPNCSISLTVHRHPEMLRCHYCDYREPLPSACPLCGGVTMQSVGAGTQQLERLVGGALSRSTAGPDGSRHHVGQVVASPYPGSRRAGRGRHPARHPDDREGDRLSPT